VSGRLNLLRRADLVLVLENGELTQSGRHAELIRQPGPYRDTALMQMMDLDEEIDANPVKIPRPEPNKPEIQFEEIRE